jgi:2'-5' RNA ligase
MRQYDVDSVAAHTANGHALWIGTSPVDPPRLLLGAMDAKDPHVTLAFIGPGRRLPAQIRGIANALQRVAKATPPFVGKADGAARFCREGSTDFDVVVLLLNAAAIGDLRTDVTRELAHSGVSHDRTFGFQPHISCGSIARRKPLQISTLPCVALRFASIYLAAGKARVEVPLGNKPEPDEL